MCCALAVRMSSQRCPISRSRVWRIFPPFFNKIVRIGHRKTSGGATPANNDLPVRLAQEHGGASVGVVRLVDTSLSALKMSWHIPRCGKASAMHLETQLHKGVTLSVEQLRAATNKVKLALQEIKQIRQRMERRRLRMLSASSSARLGNAPHRACDDPTQLVSALLELMTAAKDSLTTAQQRHCERGVLKREMFNPPLPRDVLIDSFLDHGEICIEATILCECSGFQSSHSGLTPRRVGSVFQDANGRWLEVASLHRAFGLVPHLSEVLKNLGILVEYTQKLRDKLSIFRGLSVTETTQ
eukprot:m.274262 g.274262  ORF g.274262 m.274262 type:complete len:299 (+) comp19758_c0_seq1:485-1381(+)